MWIRSNLVHANLELFCNCACRLAMSQCNTNLIPKKWPFRVWILDTDDGDHLKNTYQYRVFLPDQLQCWRSSEEEELISSCSHRWICGQTSAFLVLSSGGHHCSVLARPSSTRTLLNSFIWLCSTACKRLTHGNSWRIPSVFRLSTQCLPGVNMLSWPLVLALRALWSVHFHPIRKIWWIINDQVSIHQFTVFL